MTVEIKPHHFKGNDYVNQRNGSFRNCPLWEALKEAGHNVTRVGMYHLDIGENGYDIPNEWNEGTVTEYIKKANEGSQESAFVTLTKWED